MYSLAEYEESIRAVASNGVSISIAGYSTLGRRVYRLTKGDSRYGTILVHGAIHAREYITVPLLVTMMSEYSGRAEIVMLPMVNVDGVALVLDGLSSVEDETRREYLLRVNHMSEDFSMWKANANAVDLNVNYDAGWSLGTSNIRYPAPQNYIGPKPMSEVENQILAGETLRIRPKITLSYHSKGEVIYEGYEGERPYHEEAREIADYLGYPLMASYGSHGGYKDWYVENMHGLGLTIEVGSDSLTHPIGIEHLEEIADRHRGLLNMVSKIAEKMI